MAQYELQQQSNFTNNYTTSTGPPVVGSTQKTNLNLAQLNQERHIKNRIFGVRDRNPCEVIMFFFFKIISLGWSELLFVNQITRYEVRKMRIGNRRLNYDTTDGFGIIFRCFWNWLVNYLTFGIWYISGQMSKHYYAHLDERIYWAEEAKPRKPEPEDKIKTAGSFPNLNEYVIWQPENNCRGKIVFYSVHLGWQKELIFVLFKIGAMMTFGLLIPFVYQYYNPKFIARVYFGRGQFVVIPPQIAAQLLEKRTKESPPINYNVQYNSPYPILGETSQTMSEMKMLWTADGGDMFLRFFLGAVISNFTCGLFRCCYWYWWIYNFYNKNSHCYLDLPNQI